MANIRRVVSARLRQARVDAGLSQEELADELGLSQVGYSGIERGRTLIGVDRLVQVCGVLGRPISYFVGGGVVEIGDVSEETREVVGLMENLSQRERKAILVYVRFSAQESAQELDQE